MALGSVAGGGVRIRSKKVPLEGHMIRIGDEIRAEADLPARIIIIDVGPDPLRKPVGVEPAGVEARGARATDRKSLAQGRRTFLRSNGGARQ